MRIEILPGVSLKNKDWAEQIKQELEAQGIASTVIYWPHWETGIQQPGWIETEAQKIVGRDETVNILAKSAGAAVAMVVLKLKPEVVNKLVLCGIPQLDLEPGEESYYEPLRSFPADKVLCIQNENDNHGSYEIVEQFLHELNPQLTIVSKPRDDHEYPYPDEFAKFFGSTP